MTSQPGHERPGDTVLHQDEIEELIEAHASDGDSQPTPGALFNGLAVLNLADTATGYLPWRDNSAEGDQTLVDLTVPTEPVVLAAGRYAVSASVQGNEMSEDGFFRVQLQMDPNGVGVDISNESRLATATASYPFVSVAATFTIPEGGKIRLRVTSHDGSAARAFNIDTALIQLL